jgi:hypothetical protein
MYQVLKVMLKRIAKAIITKKIHRYQKKGTSILRIDHSGTDPFYVLITPGSKTVYLKSESEFHYPDRMPVKRFSDYVVRHGDYDEFVQKITEAKAK